MAELISCATETKLCTICGRTQFQTNFCTYAHQAAGSENYIQATVEERVGGPHIV